MKHETGRQSIFRGKDRRTRLQGILTRPGGQAFEAQRKRLAALFTKVTGQPAPKAISDGDTVEFLARGDEATITYLTKAWAKKAT